MAASVFWSFSLRTKNFSNNSCWSFSEISFLKTWKVHTRSYTWLEDLAALWEKRFVGMLFYVASIRWSPVARYFSLTDTEHPGNSQLQVFYEITFLEKFVEFTGKNLRWLHFLISCKPSCNIVPKLSFFDKLSFFTSFSP